MGRDPAAIRVRAGRPDLIIRKLVGHCQLYDSLASLDLKSLLLVGHPRLVSPPQAGDDEQPRGVRRILDELHFLRPLLFPMWYPATIEPIHIGKPDLPQATRLIPSRIQRRLHDGGWRPWLKRDLRLEAVRMGFV